MDKFITSFDGIVKVVREQPVDMPIAVVKVRNRISRNSIMENVKPIFENNSNYIRLETYFPTIHMKKGNQQTEADSIACLVIFSALKLRSDIWEMIEWMLDRLRSLSQESSGKFVAVDLRPENEMLQKKKCQINKTCFGAREVSEFLC